jgi:hypothetical protein
LQLNHSQVAHKIILQQLTHYVRTVR